MLDRSLALIGPTDWLNAKEKMSDADCAKLETWAQSYENHWHRHEEIDYLTTFQFPEFGESIASLASVVERLQLVLDRYKPYVQKHTEILLATLTWQRHQRLTRYLLVGKERSQAEDWLLTEFFEGEQSPCQPTDLQCEFICESRKNSFNLMTHAFICYDVADQAIRNEVVRQLARQAITTWRHDQDIRQGTDFTRAIEVGIETADNFLYFLSPAAIQSSYCQQELKHALRYHKRIIPLVIASTPTADIPESIRTLQHLDFTHGIQIDPLLKILHHDQTYYEQHKILLARALQWQQAHQQPAFLLRGHNLNNARIWLRLHQDRLEHPPTEHHLALITTSEAAKGQLGTEVFISYSRKDSDFARQLNLALQAAGKTTWFDQESISSGVDFEREIFKGIEGADNFILIISPDAVESPYCEREVNYANTQCKRFIPILWRPTTPTTLPPALRTINWLDFQNTPFEQVFPELIQTLDLDREHAHQHTVLQQRASDWNDNNRSKDFLLNITACQNAETWRDKALEKNKQPAPTPLQREFIQVSHDVIVSAEKTKQKQRNIILASLTAGLVIAVILLIFSGWQMTKARQAQVNAEIGQVTALTALSKTDLLLNNELNGLVKVLYAAEKNSQIPIVASRRLSAPIEDILQKLVDRVKEFNRLEIKGHHDGVSQIIFSPNSSLIATIGEDNIARLWNLKGQVIREFKAHQGNVTGIVFSPNSQLLATSGEDGTARLWNLEGEQLLELKGHQGGINDVVFSFDGQKIATAGVDGIARLWDLQGNLLLELKGHQGGINNVVFSPDDQKIATAGKDGITRLWNLSGNQLLELKPHRGGNTVTFNSNGTLLATSGEDGIVRLWNLEGQQLTEFHGTQGWVQAIFSPTGDRIVTNEFGPYVMLWDLEGKQLAKYPKHYPESDWVARGVDFTPDEQVIVAGSDGFAYLFDLNEGQVNKFGKHEGKIIKVKVSPDGNTLATVGDDDTVRLWKLKKRKNDKFLAGNTVSISPNDEYITTIDSNGLVHLWNSMGQHLFSLKSDKSTVKGISFSPDSQTLATLEQSKIDNIIQLWDLRVIY
ncbi:MAG: TIR domain-containing protein [Thioploca sp.]|nr:TIR domain-containing protein [Thioploca sp.]